MSENVRIDGVLLIRQWPEGNGQATYWCPGCESGHSIFYGGSETWDWDGNTEHPTFAPSVLVFPHETLNAAGKALLESVDQDVDAPLPELTDEHRTMTPRCHSFVRAGRIEYLPDCDHALAGGSVDMVPLPDGYREFVR